MRSIRHLTHYFHHADDGKSTKVGKAGKGEKRGKAVLFLLFDRLGKKKTMPAQNSGAEGRRKIKKRGNWIAIRHAFSVNPPLVPFEASAQMRAMAERKSSPLERRRGKRRGEGDRALHFLRLIVAHVVDKGERIREAAMGR